MAEWLARWTQLLVANRSLLDSGPLFTKHTDLSQDVAKSRSRENGCYNDRIALKFDWHLGSAAAEVPVKFRAIRKANPEILQLREFTGSCGKTPVRLVNRDHGAPGSKLASSSGSESLVVGTNPKCEIETLFIQFEFLNEDYVVGGIYRHPNGNTAHFIDDLETAIGKLKDNVTVILAGDINIDIIKLENEKTMAYLTTLLSNRFFPFITLPTRITDFSATCIDHIFVKPGGHVKQNISEIYTRGFFTVIFRTTCLAFFR